MPGDVVSFEDSSAIPVCKSAGSAAKIAQLRAFIRQPGAVPEDRQGARPRGRRGGERLVCAIVKRSLPLVAGLALGATALFGFIAACSDETTSTPGGDGADAAPDRRTAPGEDAGAEVDARADASTCELTRAYTLDCNVGSDAGDPLTCGAPKFDAWCELNDKAINSESYRRAEAMCLTKKNCASFDRQDCEYRSYLTATPTNAQKQVVAAYCQKCEPGDPSGCITRKTEYDTVLGPKSTDSVFVAAWELNDTLADAIRTKCTGAALDAGAFDGGADAAPCYVAFDKCAGDIYVDALPDCP